jgi:hypothetical protein
LAAPGGVDPSGELHQGPRADADLAGPELDLERSPATGRRLNDGVLAAEDAALLTEAFETDLSGTATEAPRFATLPVGEPDLASAARLVAVHGLRAYDAIQLASARLARSVLDDCASFAAFDQRLRAAAAAEGFNLVPPR